jgi:L-rhamnose mutarotase
MNRRFCLTLDLKDDPQLIAEYKKHHRHVWPEIIQNLRAAGVEDLEIYLLGTRLFMILEVTEAFSFESKERADRALPKLQEWETLMWNYQQPLPQARPGEKWMLMERIFRLRS